MPSFNEIGQVVVEKKIFEDFLPYTVRAAILVMCPWLFINTLVPLSVDASYKFGFDWPSGFREEDL